MRPGIHAAGDGSFGRSAGVQTIRGGVLLAVAVLVGIFLLHTAPKEGTAVTSHSPTPVKTTVPRPPATTGPASTVPPTTAGPRQPSQVSVLVVNGTTVAGAAGRIKTQLIQAGYNVVGVGNATTQDNATSSVDFVAGYQAEAQVLATALSLPATAAQPMPSPSPVSDTHGASVVVVVGSDLASQISSGPAASQPPPPTSPPTTAHHPATTVPKATTTTTKKPTATTTTVKH